jgi:hypothetical protein
LGRAKTLSKDPVWSFKSMPMNKKISKNGSSNELLDYEISIWSITLFLKSNCKLLALSVAFGLALSLVYLVIIPPQYEAVKTINLIKINSPNNPLGINLEEPSALIARIKASLFIDGDIIHLCGFEDDKNPAFIDKSIKYAVLKDSTSSIELRVVRPSIDLAKNCTLAIEGLIVATQQQLLNSISQSSRMINETRLDLIEQRLMEDRSLLDRIKSQHIPLSPIYFHVVLDIRALEDEKFRLTKSAGVTKLDWLAPNFNDEISTRKIYPKKLIILFLGAIGGFFLGLIITYLRQILIVDRD